VKLIIEGKDVVVEDVAKLLKKYKNVFLVKSLSDLLSKRGEDDHAIPTVPGVRLQARSPHRLTPKERKVLKI
jgi:hypothetical protein